MAANNLTAVAGEGSVHAHEDTRSLEKYVKPAVNIVELEDGLTILAEIAGATKENVDVNVEKGVLTIYAPASGDMPGRRIYTEFELTPYYRQFKIPEGLDQENATAELVNGVLNLRFTKAEAAKPRKIEVKVA